MDVNSELKKHSLLYMWQKKTNMKKLVDYLIATFPDYVIEEWKAKILSYDGEIETEDDFTILLKDLSRQLGVLLPHQLKKSKSSHDEADNEHEAQDNTDRKSKDSKKRSRDDQKSSNNSKVPQNYRCAVCSQAKGHWPQDCPSRTPEQMKITKAQWIEISAKAKKARLEKKNSKKQNNSSYPLAPLIADYRSFMAKAQESADHFLSTLVHNKNECVIQTVLDSGSDANVITAPALALLHITLPAGTDQPSVEMADGRVISTEGTTTIEILRLANRLILRDVRFIVIDNPEPFCLIGLPLMKSLGIDPQRDLNILLGNAPLEFNDEPDGIEDIDILQTTEQSDVLKALQALKVRTKIEMQTDLQDGKMINEFTLLIDEFKSIFRVGLDSSPAIRIEPYVPAMKPNKGPVRATPRRYNPRQSKFLRETVDKLCELGLLKLNPNSKWSSPVFLSPKKDSFRFTVDSRLVNSCIEPRAWPLPFLEVDLEKAVNSGYYAVLDADNGYFQIENDEQFAEIFSILTEDGIFTPTRLVQGTIDGVAVFQSAMMTILADQIHRTVAIWIDDVIIFADTPGKLLLELKKVFTQFAKFGVKLNPLKCTIYSREIKFCGKMISSKGVFPNSAFLQGLDMMKIPTTAGELQQFLSASNWIRNHIPNYSSIFKPLQDLLLEHTSKIGSVKKCVKNQLGIA
jgi:hypothetical protein